MATTLYRGFQEPDNKSQGLSWIQKDPSDKKDYQRDFAAEDEDGNTFLDLDASETVTDADWIVHDDQWAVLAGAAGELVVSASPAPSVSDTTATAWLEGGTAGQKYFVTCRVTTSLGRIADESFQVRVVQR